MKCPICGKNVELRNKQVGVDEQGNPVFNQYAVCKDCKKQWNLDKKRTKKTVEKKATAKQNIPDTPEKEVVSVKKAEHKAVTKTVAQKADTDVQTPVKKTAPVKKVVRKPVAKPAVEKTDIDTQAPVKKAAPVKQDPTKKVVRKPIAKPAVEKTDVDTQAPAKKATPAKQDSTKKAVRKPVAKPTVEKTDVDTQASVKKATPAKQDSTKKVVRKPASKPAAQKADADVQTPVKKAAPTKKAVKSNVSKKEKIATKSATKKFDDTIILENDEQKLGNIPSEKVRSKKEQRVKQGYAEMLAADPKSTEHKNAKAQKQPVRKEETFEDDYNEYEPIVRFRALRVIFGIISILIAAFYAFNSYSAGLLASATGVTFLILAGCMGVAGLLLIILNATNNIFAFLLPMILYLANGLYAFLNRGDDTFLLYSAIIGAAFSVLFIILAISSRGDEEDYENFDDDDDDDDDWDDDDDDDFDDDDDDDDWDDEDDDF